MREVPDLQNLQNCGDLTDGPINETSAFSFAKAPISTLRFTGTEGLTWANFERLCCRLMAKLFNLHGYRRYTKGRNQQGIDIIGYRSISPDSLVVIQCKCYDDKFDLATFKDTVNEFKQGYFYGRASEFIILVSCELLSATVEQEAIKVREELGTKHCLFSIWNGEKISEELKRYPEIVEAFYRQEVVEALCQPWGLRQRVLALLQKSYQDQGGLPLSDQIVPNEEQEDMARFLAERTVRSGGDGLFFKNFSYTDAFVRIDAYLPTQRAYAGKLLDHYKTTQSVRRFLQFRARKHNAPFRARNSNFYQKVSAILVTRITRSAACSCTVGCRRRVFA